MPRIQAPFRTLPATTTYPPRTSLPLPLNIPIYWFTHYSPTLPFTDIPLFIPAVHVAFAGTPLPSRTVPGLRTYTVAFTHATLRAPRSSQTHATTANRHLLSFTVFLYALDADFHITPSSPTFPACRHTDPIPPHAPSAPVPTFTFFFPAFLLPSFPAPA